ncbi:hypothetical protein A0H81_05001 [Grifola frondosa]|uniref:Uncharacterized protein n=1 Tax=Grifola frondosa TaxID=5627 RepID=A0A1C7MGJ2_GRIFR|nr:hypothetical protein A0H81_05001 [Grifola frondosa]
MGRKPRSRYKHLRRTPAQLQVLSNARRQKDKENEAPLHSVALRSKLNGKRTSISSQLISVQKKLAATTTMLQQAHVNHVQLQHGLDTRNNDINVLQAKITKYRAQHGNEHQQLTRARVSNVKLRERMKSIPGLERSVMQYELDVEEVQLAIGRYNRRLARHAHGGLDDSDESDGEVGNINRANEDNVDS